MKAIDRLCKTITAFHTVRFDGAYLIHKEKRVKYVIEKHFIGRNRWKVVDQFGEEQKVLNIFAAVQIIIEKEQL